MPASEPVLERVTELVSPPERVSQPADAPDEELFAQADPPPDVPTGANPESVSLGGAQCSSEVPIESHIQEIEARLDQLLRAAGETQNARDALDRMSEKLRNAKGSQSLAQDPKRAESCAEEPIDVARDIASSSYYKSQWGRVALRDRGEDVDEFGLDLKYSEAWYPIFDFLYDRWWRVSVEGIENVPATGRVALVANHAGAVPYDGVMLATALRREHPTKRTLRWLAEDFIFHFPFLGAYTNRIGAVRACQENAERLLKGEHCVGMFPEGLKGVSKLYRDRYKLQRFGRGGHVKLALRTKTPIVPVTIIGAEETHPNILSSELLAKLTGLPFVPITPTFPWLGPIGLIPMPSKWQIFFGEPLPMEGYNPGAADDDVLVGRLNEKLRATIQDTLSRVVSARRSIFK